MYYQLAQFAWRKECSTIVHGARLFNIYSRNNALHYLLTTGSGGYKCYCYCVLNCHTTVYIWTSGDKGILFQLIHFYSDIVDIWSVGLPSDTVQIWGTEHPLKMQRWSSWASFVSEVYEAFIGAVWRCLCRIGSVAAWNCSNWNKFTCCPGSRVIPMSSQGDSLWSTIIVNWLQPCCDEFVRFTPCSACCGHLMLEYHMFLWKQAFWSWSPGDS